MYAMCRFLFILYVYNNLSIFVYRYFLFSRKYLFLPTSNVFKHSIVNINNIIFPVIIITPIPTFSSNMSLFIPFNIPNISEPLFVISLKNVDNTPFVNFFSYFLSKSFSISVFSSIWSIISLFVIFALLVFRLFLCLLFLLVIYFLLCN